MGVGVKVFVGVDVEVNVGVKVLVGVKVGVGVVAHPLKVKTSPRGLLLTRAEAWLLLSS